jgi:hypothetical protein
MPPKKTQQPSLEEKKAKAEAEAKANAEREREAQKTAQTAVEAKKKAQKLGQAAAACGDPDERQKLLKQKVDQEVKAETFGKTAKWIQTSGSFQGFAAGSGLGIGLGAAVGTLTGTLVGGPTGLITGGIGAGIGKLHGPFVNVSDWGLDKIRGITGDLPGWEATEEQKKTLEKMCGQVAETEAPGPEELENIAGNVAGGTNEEAAQMVSSVQDTSDSWKKTAGSYVPSWAGGESKEGTDKQQKPAASKQQPQKSTAKSSAPAKASSETAKQSQSAEQKSSPNTRSGPRKLGKPSSTPASQKASAIPKQSSDGNQPAKRDSVSPTNESKKKPRKLEPRSNGAPAAKPKTAGADTKSTGSSTPRRSPRKLESRS